MFLCVAWPRGSEMHLRHRGVLDSGLGFGQYPWSRLPCTVSIRSAAVSKSAWLYPGIVAERTDRPTRPTELGFDALQFPNGEARDTSRGGIPS